MDNLTHSMLGAVLGQTGLKRRSGLGMPALIIGANIPDIDATCTFLGTQSLAMRRGLTHGPVAMLILPLLLTGILIAWDRWQGARGTRPADRLPVNPRWLLGLAFIGTFSHPVFDWLNSYGIRLLEPFSHQWFYGDMIFIIDIVLWPLLIGGYIWSRRAEKRNSGDWRRRGRAILAAVFAYIGANAAITGVAEARTARWVDQIAGSKPDLVVANPVPFAFWRREMLWRTQDGRYGSYPFTIFASAPPTPAPPVQLTGMNDPRIPARVAASPDAQAFLFWSRMPLAHFDGDGTMILTDQRFGARFSRGSFRVAVPPPERR